MSDSVTPEAKKVEDEDGGLIRDLTGSWKHIAFAIGVFISLAHLYFALFADVSEIMRNAFHFAGFALLCSIYYPAFKRNRFFHRGGGFWLDLLLGIIAASAAIYIALAENAIYDRGVRLVTLDWIAGFALIICAIEFTRRTAGWIIPVLIILALTYIAWWGQYLGGVFQFRGLSLETVMFRSLYGDDAIFGTIARISSTYVFLFIIFGAFLLRSGAGDFVIDLSRAVAGKLIGGPGLVAVIASGLTGTISGSAVANTASTGVITIPLMKRAGFPARFAAGVEASASTGGQLMPPIMGAGAFVMASFTLIPYETIVAVAALPALLYFASIAYFVRIEAKRQKMKPMEADGPTLMDAMKAGGASFIIPITVLITLLVMGFTPTYAAVFGCGTVVVSSWLTKNPMGPRAIVEALALGARNMIMTAVLLCAVGLIINVIATAGIGNTFSLMVSDWAGGNLLIAIVLIGLASLVLGMGLPVTAAYIVLATLSAPALAGMISDGVLIDHLVAGTLPDQGKAILMLAAPESMAALASPMPLAEAEALIHGLPLELAASLRSSALSQESLTLALLSAHMIIFWLSQDSNVTPPVCLAAFTAAAIAKSPPMATGFHSWKIAKGLYIVPMLFAYTPLLSGDFVLALQISAFALVGIYGLAAGLQGCMETPLNPLLRAVALAAGIAALWPFSLIANFAGVVVVFALLGYSVFRGRRSVAAA
jgi:TRAP transporter 4TM/12TM fusion protein